VDLQAEVVLETVQAHVMVLVVTAHQVSEDSQMGLVQVLQMALVAASVVEVALVVEEAVVDLAVVRLMVLAKNGDLVLVGDSVRKIEMDSEEDLVKKIVMVLVEAKMVVLVEIRKVQVSHITTSHFSVINIRFLCLLLGHDFFCFFSVEYLYDY